MQLVNLDECRSSLIGCPFNSAKRVVNADIIEYSPIDTLYAEKDQCHKILDDIRKNIIPNKLQCKRIKLHQNDCSIRYTPEIVRACGFNVIENRLQRLDADVYKNEIRDRKNKKVDLMLL